MEFVNKKAYMEALYKRPVYKKFSDIKNKAIRDSLIYTFVCEVSRPNMHKWLFHKILTAIAMNEIEVQFKGNKIESIALHNL